MTNFVKDQAEDMIDQINRTKTKYEQEKIDTKKLIEKVKNYLQGTVRTSVGNFWFWIIIIMFHLLLALKG